MANKIQIKRGLESNINKSNLLQGELAVTTDSNKLYVGTSKGPIQLNKDDESLVIIDYYETDDSKKEKIKSLFIKEDGTLSAHQLVKPCILLAPSIEPTNTTSIYTKCQWVCCFGDTASKLINEVTNERSTTYNLLFSSMEKGLNLTYNDRDGTITYKWLEAAIEVTYNKITKIGTPDTINDEHYPSEKAVYDYVNEKAGQSDYNQNDSIAKDYIKNRPCYEETFTLLDEKVSFKSDADGSAAHSDLLSDIPDLSKVSENTEFTLLIDTNTFNLTYRGSSSEDLDFTSALEGPVMASLLVRTDFTGLELNLYGQKGSFSNSNATVKLSGSTVHRLDPKFIQSVPDIDITPYLSGSDGFIQGTIYTKPTIVLLKDDNYFAQGDITAYLVSEGQAPGPGPR